MGRSPRMWLHVGPAKSGTSSIQTTFRINEDHLADNGILYPRISHPRWGGPGNHHAPLARALLNDEFDFVEAAISGLQDADDTLISSEAFPRCRAPRLAWLARLLERDHDLRVIYYVREPVARAVSEAGQAIKAGRATYGEILARTDPKPRFRQQLEMLERAFGRERLIVRAFAPEAFHGGTLLDDFCHVLGREGVLDGRETVRKEGAITMEDVVYLEAERRREIGEAETAVPPDLRASHARFFLPESYMEKVRRNVATDLGWLYETHGIDFRSPVEPAS